MSKTHSGMAELYDALELARRLYSRVAARDMRSHRAIRMLIAQLGIAVREARRDPETADKICHKARIKGRRLEVRIVRLAAGVWLVPGRDQVPRWANAAAYIAHPLNGDPPPETWKDAIRYIDKRGGVRNLSNLYAGVRSAHCREAIPTDNGFQGDSGFWRGGGFEDEVGERTTVEWYTPRYIFDALECSFDLDPASPGKRLAPWIPARQLFTEAEDGLRREWFGFIWLNPPFGRNVLPQWLEKFVSHGNGIVLVPERTSTQWWQGLVSRADLIMPLSRRIEFLAPSGERAGQFPIGTYLVAIGAQGVRGLINGHRNGLGLLLKPLAAADIARLAAGVQMLEIADAAD